MLSVLNENFIGLDSGTKIVRAEINVDTADELPEVDGIEGKKLYQGSVAYIITESKSVTLSSDGKWYTSSINDVNSAVANLENRINEINAALADSESRINEINTLVDNSESRIDEINTTLVDSESRIVALESEKNEKYEHIDTITLKQQGITAVERTKEPDGTLYDFKKIKVLVNCGVGEKSSPVRIFLFRPVSSTPDAYATECVSTAATKAVLICGEIKNGFASAFTCNTTIPSSTASRISIPSNEMTEASVINHLNLNLTNGTFPVNTTIDIYAVRR